MRTLDFQALLAKNGLTCTIVFIWASYLVFSFLFICFTNHIYQNTLYDQPSTIVFLVPLRKGIEVIELKFNTKSLIILVSKSQRVSKHYKKHQIFGNSITY